MAALIYSQHTAAIGDSPDTNGLVLLHGRTMKRAVRVIETYVPGLGERPNFWYESLLESVSAALGAGEAEVALLAIPTDETLMWLVWGKTDSFDPDQTSAAAILGEVASAGGRAEIERTVDGVVVWHVIDES